MTDSPPPPQLEVLVTTDEDDNTTVVLMEKLTGVQITISAASFLDMAELVCAAIEGQGIEDIPDEMAIRLH